MKTIAIITDKFLPVTQTFVYEEITGINKFNILVLTQEQRNKKLFPFDNIYVCNEKRKILKNFSKIIKGKNVKLIHVKFGTNALRYLKLKKLTGLPFVVSFHGVDASERLKNKNILSNYKKKLFPNINHVITVSEKLKTNLVKAGCPKSKITVLWSGVDVKKFYYKPRKIKNNETVKVLSIGRFVEKKGFKYLIESFARVVKSRPNTELLIIGEGKLEQKLQQHISDLHLNDKVTISNFVSHEKIPNIMHQHHIFCLPSATSSTGNEEGIPNVLKEAASTGMPIVSTYHSGIPHLIKDGKNGFLVPEKDISLLTEKLIQLIDHPETWESMGQWGRYHVEENFDKFKQARKLEEIYSNIINKTGRH